LPLWLKKKEKPWGLTGHPWLTVPLWDRPLRVTLVKIKIKVEEIVNASHRPSYWIEFKTYLVELSRRILESSEKLLFAPSNLCNRILIGGIRDFWTF